MPQTPTRYARKLGAHLRSCREAAGLGMEQVGKHLRVGQTTISRYESGARSVQWATVLSLLALYGHQEEDDPAFVKALRLWEMVQDEAKPTKLPQDASAAFRRLVYEEPGAAKIRQLETNILPGRVQDEGYMIALAQSSGDPSLRNSDVRKARQAHINPDLRPNPVEYHLVLDEICVTRLVGGATVMIPQLRHLLRIAEWDNVTIQVIPKEAGDYGGATGGFTILDFDDEDDPSWVYFEYQNGNALEDNPKHVQRFAKLFNDAAPAPKPDDEEKEGDGVSRKIALSPDETIEFIRRQIEVLEDR
ncbi:helix-turn-helix domain-containing protein [Amycolatopsis sp. VC5-11]|uniref:helix-turn-helix domain-containing protein n=1 Tax=Amycolatopsis sp. VC5-11 TaxID=3120156 RepID=UPI003009A777